MFREDSPYLVDWISISLRWFLVLGFAVALSRVGDISATISIVFLCASVWNLILTFMAAVHLRLPSHRVICVVMDLAISNLLFYFSKQPLEIVSWTAFLPILSASLYFELRGALVVATIFIMMLGFQSLNMQYRDQALVAFTSTGILYLLFGLFFGVLARWIIAGIHRYRDRMEIRRKEITRLERERLWEIYNLTTQLNQTLNYLKVLEIALDLSVRALASMRAPAIQLVSAILLFTDQTASENTLYVGSARGFTPEDIQIELPGNTGLLGEIIQMAEPAGSTDIPADPEISQFQALRTCNSVYGFPLKTGTYHHGVFLCAHPAADFFTDERISILDIIGRQTAIAIQNARLYNSLEEEKVRMITIQDEARKKLARDLHDGPTQSIAAITMRINYARRLIERNPENAKDELVKLEDLARGTTKEIRQMLFTLRPLTLESQGLIAALESMAEKIKDTYNQKVIVLASPHVADDIGLGKQAVVFYIAEEAVNNARKHAEANRIEINLKRIADDVVELEITDDGVGFNVGAVDASYDQRSSLGMVNMRERAEIINGLLQINSTEGAGTQIRLLIPLTQDASERIKKTGI